MPILDSSSLEVQHLSERDWRLRHLMEALGPLSYSSEGTAYAHLAFSVIEQMLSMKAGRHTIEARLKDACGGEISPEAVQALGIEGMRSCGIAQRKAQTLLDLAKDMPEVRLQSLKDMEDDEVRAALTSVRGVGRWTADMYLIFYLLRPDVLPLEDGAVCQSFRWLYGVPLADDNVQKAICSLWHPYASAAVRYLYRALNEGLLAKGTAEDILGLG